MMSDVHVTTSDAFHAAARGSITVSTHADAKRYAVVVAGGSFATACAIAAVLAIANEPTWWRGFAGASLAAFASTTLALAITLPAFGRPMTTLMSSLLVAGLVRTALLGMIVAYAIKGASYPANSTLAIAGLYYAALVALEGVALSSLTAQPLPTRDRA